jgi:hypothetical protein
MKRTENVYRMAQQLKHLRALLKGEKKSKYDSSQVCDLLRLCPLTELSPAVIHQFFATAVPVAGPLDTPCLIWPEPRDKDGYGIFYANGQRFAAHRLACELSQGAIPQGKSVMHLCNEPACINGQHLRVGTHKENMEYKSESGRVWNQHTPPIAKVPILTVSEYQEGEMVI